MSKYGYFLMGKSSAESLEEELNKYSTERLLDEVRRYKEFKRTREVTIQNQFSLCYTYSKKWPKDTNEIFEVYNAIARVLAERLLEINKTPNK